MAQHDVLPAQHREAPRREKTTRTPESLERLLTVEELERDAQQILDRAMESAQQAVRRQEKRLTNGLKQAGVKQDSTEYQEALDTFQGSNTLDEFRRRFGAFGKWLINIGMAASLEQSIPESPDVGTFDHHKEAAAQIAHDGITAERREAYMPGVSESVYRVIIPIGDLDSFSDLISAIPENILKGRTGRNTNTFVMEENQQYMQQRNDAYRLYLGLPQQHGTIGVSEYRPSGGTEDKYYYNVNGWLDQFALNHDLPENVDRPMLIEHIVAVVQQDPQLMETYRQDLERERTSAVQEMLRLEKAISRRRMELQSMIEREHKDYQTWDQKTRNNAYWEKEDGDTEIVQLRKHYSDTSRRVDSFSQLLSETKSPSWIDSHENNSAIVTGDPVMGHYKLSIGHDAKGEYLSYYDVWDYGQPGQSGKGLVELTEGFIGKPYELYDRIYFDRDTWTVKAGS